MTKSFFKKKSLERESGTGFIRRKKKRSIRIE